MSARPLPPRCYTCLSYDVAIKVIDQYGFEHWLCAEDWEADERFRERLAEIWSEQ